MKKTLITMLLLVAMLLGMASCGMTEKVYTKDGVSITLPGDFTVGEGFQNYGFCFERNDCYVAVMIETFDELTQAGLDPETLNAAQYADIIYEDLDAGYPAAQGKMVCVEFGEEIDGDDYSYLLGTQKMDGAFVTFHFACFKEDYSSYKQKFIEWGNSATYSK